MKLRLQQLEQNDPTLTPLLARAVTEFGRRAEQKKPNPEPLPTCMPIGIQRSVITGRFGLWFEGSPECIPAETVLAEYPLTDDQKAQLRAELKEMGWVEY